MSQEERIIDEREAAGWAFLWPTDDTVELAGRLSTRANAICANAHNVREAPDFSTLDGNAEREDLAISVGSADGSRLLLGVAGVEGFASVRTDLDSPGFMSGAWIRRWAVGSDRLRQLREMRSGMREVATSCLRAMKVTGPGQRKTRAEIMQYTAGVVLPGVPDHVVDQQEHQGMATAWRGIRVVLQLEDGPDRWLLGDGPDSVAEIPHVRGGVALLDLRKRSEQKDSGRRGPNFSVWMGEGGTGSSLVLTPYSAHTIAQIDGYLASRGLAPPV